MDHEKIVRTQTVAKETPEGVVIELIVSHLVQRVQESTE